MVLLSRRYAWISAAALLVGAFLFSRDYLANLVWQKYGKPDLALVLVERDADLAMLLGSYYFGGTFGESEYDLAKAKRAYKKAVKADPSILWGHYQLARIYFVEGDFGRALSEISRELEANPENLRALYVRGLIYGYQNQQGDLERAEEDFGRFTEWIPKEWAGYNDHAWVLSRLGRHGDARRVIRSAFENTPDSASNPWLWNALGLAELNLGDLESARESFTVALKFARKLTAGDWVRAYPGNDPADAESGLTAFREAIEENIQRSSRGDN